MLQCRDLLEAQGEFKMNFGLIYIIVSIALSIIAVFVGGYWTQKDKEKGYKDDGLLVVLLVGIVWMWPAVLLILPFIGIYLLGKAYARNRSQKKGA